ncbi:MAG: leucyl/phenylalanyl-tRNA--protein transferase [Bacteroidota bacterium]
MPIQWLSPFDVTFPNPSLANEDGILAVGGDLSVMRLLEAYRLGIFPWYSENDPILWWSPDPRMVLFPENLVVSHSMRPLLKQQRFRVSVNQCFEEVMRNCRVSRRNGQQGTWINDEIEDSYAALHEKGFAHSCEVWDGEQLVGGLYGVALGRVFFGESMFAHVSNASKFGFITFVQHLQKLGIWLIDCQQETRHLGSLGASPIERNEFNKILKKNENEPQILKNAFQDASKFRDLLKL